MFCHGRCLCQNVLVFALLMLSFKRLGVSMSSISLCIFTLGECHVVFLDSLCGCNVFAKVSSYEFKKSLIGFSCAKAAYSSSSLFICIWADFCIPVSLHNEEVFPLSFLDSFLKLFVELTRRLRSHPLADHMTVNKLPLSQNGDRVSCIESACLLKPSSDIAW